MKKNAQDLRFRFSSRLVRVAPGGFYAVDVPVRISKIIGKRGPIPVHAWVNKKVEFSASLSPAGSGKHRLRMNSRTREIAEIQVGDSVHVHIIVLGHSQKIDLPYDLKNALLGEGVLETFEALAPGKQRHIVEWIERSVRPETREKRIRFTLEMTHLRREKRLGL